MMGHNQYDAGSVGDFVRRWEFLDTEAKNEKRAISERLKEDRDALLDEAEAAGLPRSILKKFFASLADIRKAARRSDELDIDGQAQFAMLLDAAKAALGPLLDTSLGQAAIAAIEAERPAEPEPEKKPAKPRKTREERLAELNEAAKTVPWGAPPKRSRKAKDAAAGEPDPRQADLEEAASAAAARDEAGADAEVARFMDTTTNERLAGEGAPWPDDAAVDARRAGAEAAA
jgi:hypothetical protein